MKQVLLLSLLSSVEFGLYELVFSEAFLLCAASPCFSDALISSVEMRFITVISFWKKKKVIVLCGAP